MAVVVVVVVLVVLLVCEEGLRVGMRGGAGGLAGVCDKRRWNCNNARGLNMVVCVQLGVAVEKMSLSLSRRSRG